MSGKFPVDAPKRKVIKTFELLGFEMVRERKHIAMVRRDADGATTSPTMPNHPKIKGSILRAICYSAGSQRRSF